MENPGTVTATRQVELAAMRTMIEASLRSSVPRAMGVQAPSLRDEMM